MLVVVIFGVGIPIVYLLSKALKIRPKPIAIGEPRKEATLAVIVYVVLFVWFFAWVTLTKMFQIEPLRLTVDVTVVLWVAFEYGVAFLIVIVAMTSTRQNLGTLGINKNDLGRMIALGLTPGGILLIVGGLLASIMGGGFTGFSSSFAYSLILTVMVGFSEELFSRGYIQTRLSAYGGTIKGFVVTSLLFALWHFPGAYYYEASGDVLAALAYALLRLPTGLLLGYIMLKSQNIIPSSIFHFLFNWSGYIWRIL